MNRTPARTRLSRTVRVCICCAALIAAALPLAQANQTLQLEFGLGYVDQDSTRFARYNGLDRNGGYGVLNIDWWRQAAEDAEHPAEMRLTIRDLGLDTRSVAVERQRTGVYRIWLSYVELPVYSSQPGLTPFIGGGGSVLRLPSNWQPGTTTSGMGQLLPSLSSFTPITERRRIGFGLDRWLSNRWDTQARMSQEHKQGMRVLAGTIGNTGGNPRSAFLPTPVDYRTREAEWALRYGAPTLQFELRYLISLFDNADSALRWQNPYSAINGWHPSAGFPTGEGQLALPPDNQFHQLSTTLARSWSNGLRLVGDFSFGRATQDAPFLPYTINPQLTASITQALPRNSLDGRVDTQRGQLHLSQRIGARFDWAARLRQDQHDNRTPHEEFVYIAGDSALQNTGESSSQRRFNEPYSFDQTLISLDAGYRTGRHGRLQAFWQQRDVSRELAERLRTEEDRFGLSFRQRLHAKVALALKLEQADRDGSTYVGNRPFLSAYSPGYTRTVAGEFENHPDLRRYHLADRQRRQWGGNLSVELSPVWQLQFDAQRIEDDYRRSALGLRKADSEVFSADLTLLPGDGWSAHLFHVRERHQQAQDGLAFSGGGNRLLQAFDPDRQWRAEHGDRIDSTGLSGQWQPVDQRLSLSLDFIHSRGRSGMDFSSGPAITVLPLPDETSRLNSVRLGARWRFDDRLELHLRAWNERYREFNATREALAVDQLANVLWFGEESGDYQVNVFTFSLVYRF